MKTEHTFWLVALLALALTPAAQAEEQVPLVEAHDMMEWERTAFVISEVLEYLPLGESRPVRYDLEGWVGGAYNRVWVKAEGEQATTDSGGAAGLELLYGRLISPFWDLQLGLATDLQYGGQTNRRVAVGMGLQGLAPGWFELEPTVFVSHRGDVSASLTASYDLLLTQRLVAQPRLDTGVAVQEVPEFGVGAGWNDLGLALRIRYEIWREVAPYVGISWERRFGGAARLARAAGEPASELSLVAGLRLWY